MKSLQKLFVITAILFFATICHAADALDLPMYNSMQPVKDSSGYLYEAYYPANKIEGYVAANKMIKEFFSVPEISCSTVRKGNLYGRNFDFVYNQTPDTVIHTPAGNGNYATICMEGGVFETALGLKNLEMTKARLDKILAGAKPNEIETYLLQLLPYIAVDGINEKGVVCCINIAQKGSGIGKTTGTNPGATFELHAVLCPSYILNCCATAKEAIETLKGINIWAYDESQIEKIYSEYHFMIADPNETYVVEFRNNKMLVREVSDKPYMTNFNLLLSDNTTVSFDDKGHVKPETIINYAGDEVTKDWGNGCGIHRYNLIADSYAKLSGHEDMRSLLDSIAYGQFYKQPKPFFDEFVGVTELYIPYIKQVCKTDIDDDFKNLTIKTATNTEAVDALYSKYNIGEAMQLILDTLTRDNNKAMLFQATHSCIYDISAKKLWVKEQELGKETGAWSKEHCFALNKENSSSGGCNSGFGALILLFVIALPAVKKYGKKAA